MNVSNLPRIDTADVKRSAIARMRENHNYLRTAQLLLMLLLLINVPVLLMNYLSVNLTDVKTLNTPALQALNLRLILFQALVGLLITPAFELSKTRFMLNTMRERAGKPDTLFDGLGKGNYFVAVRAALWKALMLYLWLMIPLSTMLNGVLMGSPILLIAGGALTIGVMVNRSLAYSFQMYFLSERPRLGAIMSLRLSRLALMGRLKEELILQLRLWAYILPPLIPNVASMLFYKDSMWFGILMSACTILLSALCMPVVEGATAEYFLRVKATLEAAARNMQREHDAIWSEENGSDDGQDTPN